MRKRLGECEYCSVPIMAGDYHCVGCGAPANSKIKGSVINQRETIEVPDPDRFGQFITIATVGRA